MVRLFSGVARVGTARLIDPLARWLLRLGISPNLVTVVGTAGVVVGGIGFAARGRFVAAVLIVGAFALVDLVDGAMARAQGAAGRGDASLGADHSPGGSRFGAVLDSTMDRIADGAIFGAIGYWYATVGEPATVAAALVCLVGGQVTSYVRARAGSVGIDCEVGVAERTERLLLAGVGAFVTGLGVGWALPVALWLLAILSSVTVAQRVAHVRREDRRDERQVRS